MKTVYMDFWKPNTLLKGISEIYDLDGKTIIGLMKKYNNQEELLSAFFELSGIHPDTYSLENVLIRCKVVGKYPDTSMLQSEGLLPLTKLLMKDSYLVRFLAENGIAINVSDRFLVYQGRKIRIQDADCLGCKLYHDNGEIEAFYCASTEMMLGYSTVKEYPEILYTVDVFLKKHGYDPLGLGRKWAHRTKGFDIISFYVDLSSTTYINGCDLDYSSIWPYEEYLEGDYPYTDSYPMTLYRNLWLLKTAFGRIQGDMYSDSCLGIEVNTEIPYAELEIQHFDS